MSRVSVYSIDKCLKSQKIILHTSVPLELFQLSLATINKVIYGCNTYGLCISYM